jgi:hypothetical protein
MESFFKNISDAITIFEQESNCSAFPTHRQTDLLDFANKETFLNIAGDATIYEHQVRSNIKYYGALPMHRQT